MQEAFYRRYIRIVSLLFFLKKSISLTTCLCLILTVIDLLYSHLLYFYLFGFHCAYCRMLNAEIIQSQSMLKWLTACASKSIQSFGFDKIAKPLGTLNRWSGHLFVLRICRCQAVVWSSPLDCLHKLHAEVTTALELMSVRFYC